MADDTKLKKWHRKLLTQLIKLSVGKCAGKSKGVSNRVRCETKVTHWSRLHDQASHWLTSLSTSDFLTLSHPHSIGTSEMLRLMQQAALTHDLHSLYKLVKMSSLWTCLIYGFDDAVLTACLHLFISSGRDVSDDLFHLSRLSTRFRIWPQEFVLRTSSCLLSQRDVRESQQLLDLSERILKLRPSIEPRTKWLSKTGRQHVAETLQNVYRGLIEYGQFCELRRSNESRTYYIDGLLQEKAKRAVLYVEPIFLIGVGPWQTYISIYLDLLMYLDEKTKAMKFLESYCAQHSDNYQVLQTLYTFLVDSSVDGEVSGTTLELILERIIHFCPSDFNAVQNLCNLRHQQTTSASSYSACLSMFFTLLDYSKHRNNPLIWQLTSKHLILSFEPGSKGVWTSIWADRSSWWPNYHFYPQEKEINKDTSLPKYIIAYFLMGRRDAAVRNLKKMLPRQDKPFVRKMLETF